MAGQANLAEVAVSAEASKPWILSWLLRDTVVSAVRGASGWSTARVFTTARDLTACVVATMSDAAAARDSTARARAASRRFARFTRDQHIDVARVCARAAFTARAATGGHSGVVRFTAASAGHREHDQRSQYASQ